MLAAFLSTFGRVEEINLLRSAARTAYGDYIFQMCLTQEGFQAIHETIVSRDRQMMVIVEGRRPRCWSCKQLGHISKFCPQKDPPKAPATAAATVTTETTATTVSTVTISNATPEKEPDQAQQKKADDWIEVTHKKKKSPKKAEDKTTSASHAKEMEPVPAKATTSAVFIPTSVTAPISSSILLQPRLEKKPRANQFPSHQFPLLQKHKKHKKLQWRQPQI